MIIRKIFVLFLLGCLSIPISVYGHVNDYLILEDIGSYRFITQTKNPLTKKVIQILGYTVRSGAGILAGADHFDLDHIDTTYETKYESEVADLGLRVQVIQHAGSDSDKWLLHELDTDFRNYYGIPGRSYGPREIEGQTVLEDAIAGADYRWVSSDKVITIKYRDSEMTKPEPIEVVKAYLAKHPSTLPPLILAELRSPEMKTIWIKGEMERRLWLCGKWFLQLQTGKAEQDETLRAVVKCLVIFLDYREKYYGITGKDEKSALEKYFYTKDGTVIKSKLAEYKTWWSVNKMKPINLP